MHENYASLTIDTLKEFCIKHNLDFSKNVLDIKVECKYENYTNSYSIRSLIDYTDEEEKCVLSQGSWYQYNDDYIKYLEDAIATI